MGNKSAIEEEFEIRSIYQKEVKKNCQKEIEDFVQCATGRTVSVLWKCRQQSRVMNGCLQKTIDQTSEWRLRSHQEGEKQKAFQGQIEKE
ncbi:copper-binding protein of the mitochondrial inner membrane Cmc2 [Schizosaccharomyces osmophilus]|uniref:COX assembly mitochondrial protein n=1 Tax=Schizosaccharomyces osmophilus TaxID=2545709 RepID=A0AAE9WFZ9_9SCHI|nr:copper-binding protein of the mitochondrial inner membrane Cmc2 [Schizosaccharomyces osmophilus]WBW74964.1 copper-binding protein of the mitochondrial inner membrane Cmc2 [Schizosaccharomyces osmophilus]